MRPVFVFIAIRVAAKQAAQGLWIPGSSLRDAPE